MNPFAAWLRRSASTRLLFRMTEEDDSLIRELNEFAAEVERVCPEAANGLAIGGAPPPPLSRRQLISLLKQLPDNAGADRLMAAWYATSADPPLATRPSITGTDPRTSR